MAYSLGQDPSGSVNINGVLMTANSSFVVQNNGVTSVFLNDGTILIDGALPADITYILTDAPFASYSALEDFVNGHFFKVYSSYPDFIFHNQYAVPIRQADDGSQHNLTVESGELLFDGVPIGSGVPGGGLTFKQILRIKSIGK